MKQRPIQDAYGYNARSEVTSARRTLGSNSNQEVRGFSHDYAYDPIGNRTSSTEYDHEDNALVSSYAANELDQYSQRTVPGYAGVRGSATNNATVTVNGNSAWRLGEYFYGGDDVENAASAVMKDLDITAVVNPSGTNEADLVESVTGKVFVAKSPEAFTYDDDGNLLSDGRFVYTWDGENRLASIETSDAAASAGAPRVRVEYSYDHRSRRIGKVVSNLDGETWTVAESRSFLYDGWNMIREIQYSTIPSFHSSTNSYTWGLDLSGSLQGAGGVGGLLAVVSPLPLGERQGEGSTVYLPCYDGNGNVCEYSSTDGTLVAHYEYLPFGETVTQSGAMADTFAFRFSTKYWENEAKLYYYGYRFYAPNVGRWLNRDPIGEGGGGYALYKFLNNWPIGSTDLLGLSFSISEMSVDINFLIDNYNLWGFTDTPAVTFSGEDSILEFKGTNPSRCHCAGVLSGKKIDVEGNSLVPNEGEIGNLFTTQGHADILEHERKRVKVYRLGYANYFAPSQGSAQHVTRCNNVCSKTPGAAKTALLAYLAALREKAKTGYDEYTRTQQLGIGELENDSENNWRWSVKITISSNPDTPIKIRDLFDGHKQKYTVKLPPKFTQPKCPKDIDNTGN